MNIFLLGNGFDLHHKLPTSYASFLHTINFLKDHQTSSLDTVGKVFGNESLATVDKHIRESYQKHQQIYDAIPLDRAKIDFLVKTASNNPWFKYLSNSLGSQIGWIDFETEITRVLESFSKFLSSIKRTDESIDHYLKEKDDKHRVKSFDFFIKRTYEQLIYSGIVSQDTFHDDYLLEDPLGSERIVVNKQGIANKLFEFLIELSDMLKTYLHCFIESTVDILKKDPPQTRSMLLEANYVFTLNYTNTYEALYGYGHVNHIHGSVYDKIVLGINSNDYDELDKLDTTFIPFKKYYQRVLYRTDIEYLKSIETIRKRCAHEKIALYVIGHSLDSTDREIIQELFDVASEIVIHYHTQDAIGKYISNLISIYGKKEFDQIRSKKKLQFIKVLSSD